MAIDWTPISTSRDFFNSAARYSELASQGISNSAEMLNKSIKTYQDNVRAVNEGKLKDMIGTAKNWEEFSSPEFQSKLSDLSKSFHGEITPGKATEIIQLANKGIKARDQEDLTEKYRLGVLKNQQAADRYVQLMELSQSQTLTPEQRVALQKEQASLRNNLLSTIGIDNFNKLTSQGNANIDNMLKHMQVIANIGSTFTGTNLSNIQEFNRATTLEGEAANQGIKLTTAKPLLQNNAYVGSAVPTDGLGGTWYNNNGVISPMSSEPKQPSTNTPVTPPALPNPTPTNTTANRSYRSLDAYANPMKLWFNV